MHRLTPIAFTTLLFACAADPPQVENKPSRNEVNTGVRIGIDDLAGQWLDVQDSGRTYVHERWERDPNGTMTGLGCVLSGKDTVFIENMAIVTVNDTFYYAVNTGPGSGEAVLFKLVHDRDSLVFTNPAHDMPQRIVYVPQGPDGWHAIVSGTNGGKTVTDHYRFTRLPLAVEPPH